MSGLDRERIEQHPGGAERYRPYTTRFDVVARASELHRHLGRLDPHDQAQLDEAWEQVQGGLAAWRTKLHLIASEADARVRTRLMADERAATIVSLLFDQSGSMRGQKMIFAAAAADVAREFLVTLGVRCEILGFTTVRWRGGKSRRRWTWRFRPRRPGRLNDLLHIVYTDADDVRASTGAPGLKQMLRHDLPKENVDGEAILWASDRLLSRPEPRKLLIVISDGAPVDDSTLLENGLDYLANHLRTVVETLNAAAAVELGTLGIGYACEDFYNTSAHVDAPSDLGKALVELLERMLVRSSAL
jgi:cobaltochelatase CobT